MQDITLLNATYNDVPAVQLPKSGGGLASFTDVTDTTATASDVAQGKYFYTSSGERTEGTASGGGGGYSLEDIASGAEPSGAITLTGTIRRAAFTYATNITSVTIANTVTSIGQDAFSYSNIQYLTCNANKNSNYMIRGCASLKEARFPGWGSTGGFGGYGLQNCTSLELIDYGSANSLLFNSLASCPLHTIIARKTGSVATLTANSLNNSSAFKSGGTGGTVYVPNDLIASYKTATNWATYYGYGTMEFKAIEGSIYEL